MLLPVLKALLGHYRRYPLQFLLVWLGLTLGVSLLIAVTTINYHAQLGYRPEFGALGQAFNMNLQAMGLIAFLVGLFIFYQAMSLSFIQRQPLVEMLRQAGVSGIDLTKAIFIELLLLILISWLCGNIFGLFLANQLLPQINAAIEIPVQGGLFYIINWWWCFYSLILTIIGASAACIWPLTRLLKAPPIRLTERLSMVRFAGMEFAFQAFIAVILAIVALVLFYTNHSPETGFGVLALILVSVALLTPFVVWKSFDVLSYRLKGVRIRWFFADAAASMSYRGVATMAFLIALATNIAAETMVGSFRQTSSQWLEQRLAADFYFYVPPQQSDSVDEWLRSQTNVRDVWQRWETDVMTTSGAFDVVSIGSSDAESASMTIKVAEPEYWYQLHHGRNVLISESASSKLGLRTGDKIDLGDELGRSWTVSGVYYDYANPNFQIMISDYQWQKHFKSSGELIFAAVLDDKSQLNSVRQQLEQTLHLDADQLFDNQHIRSSVLGIFNKTFSVVATLGNITLLIAVCGIFVATLAGEVARQRHFTLLRCFGVSAKELVAIGGYQLLIFGVICMAIALPLGLLLAKLILDTSIKSAFGWSIPLHYFISDFLFTTIWSLLALVCSGAIPVIRLILRSPMDILRSSQ